MAEKQVLNYKETVNHQIVENFDILHTILDPSEFSVLVSLIDLQAAFTTQDITKYIERKKKQLPDMIVLHTFKTTQKILDNFYELGIIGKRDIPTRKGKWFWFISPKFQAVYNKRKRELYDELRELKESSKKVDAEKFMIKKYGYPCCIFYGIITKSL